VTSDYQRRKARARNAEHRVAEILGGERLIGNRGQAIEDVKHDFFSVEVKQRKQIPALLRDAWAQAVMNAKADGKQPLVVIHAQGSHDYMAVLPLEVVRELYERAGL
jgi:hypothetical protein